MYLNWADDQQKITNRSAVLLFELLSKRLGFGPSSVELQVLVTPLMKGQARNVWRGTQSTTRHFCSLFFVEHSLTF